MVKKLQKSWLEAWQRAEVRIWAENEDNLLNMVQLNQHYTHFLLSSMHREQAKTHLPADKQNKPKDPKVSFELIVEIIGKM